MGRNRTRSSTRTGKKLVTSSIRVISGGSFESNNLKNELCILRPSTDSRIYLPREIMLVAVFFPITRILYYWNQFPENRTIVPLLFKLLVALVVSMMSAVAAATAVWWPRDFKRKVEIDSNCSRMGLLFCVFGAQVGHSASQTLPRIWGRSMVTLVALVATVGWEHLTQSWHNREVFHIGCFLSGASIPTYLYISITILLELFVDKWVNLAFVMYAVITLIGVVMYRPSPILASGYLLTLLLIVPNSYSYG